MTFTNKCFNVYNMYLADQNTIHVLRMCLGGLQEIVKVAKLFNYKSFYKYNLYFL